jgi:hypothetical protein
MPLAEIVWIGVEKFYKLGKIESRLLARESMKRLANKNLA